ncbi:hypothetical protein D3C81_1303260 [compost metagenome]
MITVVIPTDQIASVNGRYFRQLSSIIAAYNIPNTYLLRLWHAQILRRNFESERPPQRDRTSDMRVEYLAWRALGDSLAEWFTVVERRY